MLEEAGAAPLKRAVATLAALEEVGAFVLLTQKL